jgi:hypothetical protein
MSDSFRTSPPEPPWSSSSKASNGYQGAFGEKSPPDDETGEVGKVLLVGVLGGLLSAAGFMIYRRLPEDQKQRLNRQIRAMVAERISELRQNFNI